MTQTNPPEFGENGAVMNSETMTENLRDDYKDPSRVYTKRSLRWEAWFWPFLSLIWIGLAIEVFRYGGSQFRMTLSILAVIAVMARAVYSVRTYNKSKSGTDQA